MTTTNNSVGSPADLAYHCRQWLCGGTPLYREYSAVNSPLGAARNYSLGIMALGCARADDIIPFAMKSGWNDIQGFHFGVSDLAAFLIEAAVERSFHNKSCGGSSRSNQIDDDLVRFERLPSPSVGDVAEYAMLDFVPFAGSGW